MAKMSLKNHVDKIENRATVKNANFSGRSKVEGGSNDFLER